MDWLSKDTLIPLAIGFAIIFGGARLLKQKNRPLTTRVLLGLTLLAIGIGCGYYLIYVAEGLERHPLLFGLAVGATGLGINQATAPLRVAAGSAA